MVIGMSHVKTPISIRERMNQSIDEIDFVIQQCKMTGNIVEHVIVSTCNRMELYLVSSNVAQTKGRILDCVARCTGLSLGDCTNTHVYIYEGRAAVEHAMRVASGLDSIVIGETQILGQMRDAYLRSEEMGYVGALLDRMFQTVIHVGKRVHAELHINNASLSIPYVAVDSAKRWLREVQEKQGKALVLGAGAMGTLVTQHLLSQGFSEVVISNRTEKRAKDVAIQTGGKYAPWSAVMDVASTVNVIIACTSSPNPILFSRDVEKVASKREGVPLLLLDLGLPRNIQVTFVSTRHDMSLYDIDHFKEMVRSNSEQRHMQIKAVERIVAQELSAFDGWLESLKIAPMIQALRVKGSYVHTDVMQSLRNKLPGLEQTEYKIISKLMMSVVNQLLRAPTLYLKENADIVDELDVDRLVRFLGIESFMNDDGHSEMSTRTDNVVHNINPISLLRRELA